MSAKRAIAFLVKKIFTFCQQMKSELEWTITLMIGLVFIVLLVTFFYSTVCESFPALFADSADGKDRS
jgi:hypothetical protein